MNDSANSSPPSPKDLIEQARGIIMNRFDLDADQALKVLRRMSQATKARMCAVAEQVVNYNDPTAALRRLEEDALLRLTPEAER